MEDGVLMKLTGVFREVFADDSLVLSRKKTAMDIDGWDSLAHVTLMLSVQRAFHVRHCHREIWNSPPFLDGFGRLRTRTWRKV